MHQRDGATVICVFSVSAAFFPQLCPFPKPIIECTHACVHAICLVAKKKVIQQDMV